MTKYPNRSDQPVNTFKKFRTPLAPLKYRPRGEIGQIPLPQYRDNFRYLLESKGKGRLTNQDREYLKQFHCLSIKRERVVLDFS